MRIGILGSGLMGGALGRAWAESGHDVTFAYSRDRSKLEGLAEETGGSAASVAEAVARADALLLSVHWSRIDDVLEQAGNLAGKIVLNCCVPLDERNSDLVLGTATSGAEELARRRPEARWVSCFNTVPSEAFAPVRALNGDAPRPQVLTYGDDAEAKDIARALVRDAGFEPLEAGPLRTGRFVEPFAMVTAELAYAQPGGPALTYRFEKLNQEETL
ncbi:NADPH-dependent F420 reductase [Histidinibacterium aquaticum]|uniref:Transmembrane reductase oxidoreductase n=1 Tax=Histidinibacterium aquaticum TaxID=2613962 RepID=A0A5J5GC58_9RHOB|nr:NAD(P)-binding domain-containing protein [Histidinibacterium aquaticum]KAA9005550.1 transmembrane reductase oxidoreductase [Histidinibacterium aquaticum]